MQAEGGWAKIRGRSEALGNSSRRCSDAVAILRSQCEEARMPKKRTIEAEALRALRAVRKIRPENWDDEDDPEQAAAWTKVEKVLKAVGAA